MMGGTRSEGAVKGRERERFKLNAVHVGVGVRVHLMDVSSPRLLLLNVKRFVVLQHFVALQHFVVLN